MAHDPEVITNEDGFGRFEARHPRNAGETDSDYVMRHEKLGTCVGLASHQLRDITVYKQALSEARRDRVPLLIVTPPVPNPIADRAAESAAKSKEDHLAEARRADYLRNRGR